MSEYDDIVNEAKMTYRKITGEYIPKAYQALINEGLTPMDARERIEKDFIEMLSLRTIQRNLPDEAKHIEKRPKTRPTMITVTNEGKQDIATVAPPPPSTGYKPLPVETSKPQQPTTTQKLRLSYDLDIKGQIIPLTVRLYVDWNTKEIDIDRMDIEL